MSSLPVDPGGPLSVEAGQLIWLIPETGEAVANRQVRALLSTGAEAQRREMRAQLIASGPGEGEEMAGGARVEFPAGPTSGGKK